MEELKMAEANNKDENKDIEIPDTLPVLPVRDIVIFPYMILPLFVGRDVSIKAIDHALNTNRMVLLLAQKDLNVEAPATDDLYLMGTVCMIMRMLKLPDGRVKILVQGLSKARVTGFSQQEPFFMAGIKKVTEETPTEATLENEALIRSVKEQMDKVVSLGRTILPDVMVVIENIEDPGRLADLITANLGLKTDQAQEI
ncbi:MAG: LON peptidase substrate-binding domain-containing protein, partial [Nitrospirae bacterium]|nr:LON peptidase substrate-binding domain-containing protein [Nitrospirota bacterium]